MLPRIFKGVPLLLIGVLLLGVTSCGGDSKESDRSAPTSNATAVGDVVWPGDDWEVSSPEAEGMYAASFDAMADYCEGHGCRAVVVVRHGRIVWERYWGDWTAASTDNSWSMAKSVTSALVGIAINEGKIKGVDQPAADFIPEWRGTDREKITIGNLLSMESGLMWAMMYDPPSGDTITLMGSEDAVGYASSRPLYREPGSDWYYSDGDVMNLSHVLKTATGMEPREYAQEKLFGPIGLQVENWTTDARGQTMTFCCIFSSARDFARFGYLYLRGGLWDDQQVVPAEWVKRSTQPSQIDNMNYGYLWWLYDFPGTPTDTFAAMGFQTKRIYVIPSLDIVAVRLGKGSDADWDESAFLKPIVDAVKQ